MVKQEKVTPSLESIVIKGRFRVLDIKLQKIQGLINEVYGERQWIVLQKRNLFQVQLNPESYGRSRKSLKDKWIKMIKKIRPGYPVDVYILVVDRQEQESVVDIECRPCMYYKITQMDQLEYPKHVIQEAQIECKQLGSALMAILEGQEVVPLSVYPAISRGEIRDKLMKLGLKEIVRHLSDAEKHLTQENYEDSLHNSRTAFEKAIEYVMGKRRLELTNQTTTNIERLKKGFLDDDTAKLLEEYYHFLSNVGTHGKGAQPGDFEARLGYDFTVVSLNYLIDKL